MEPFVLPESEVYNSGGGGFSQNFRILKLYLNPLIKDQVQRTSTNDRNSPNRRRLSIVKKIQ